MRATLIAALLLVSAGALPLRAEDGVPLTLEYRRLYASQEEVRFAVDSTGHVTGTVRAFAADGIGQAQPFESWLPLSPTLAAAFDAAGLWKADPGAAADEAAPGVRISASAGAQKKEVHRSEAELSAQTELAVACGACEVLSGAALRLARGRRERAAKSEPDWAAACAEYGAGIERLPRVFPVRGPDPRVLVRLADEEKKFAEWAPQLRALLDSEIDLVAGFLRRGELERFFPDAGLWPEAWRPAWPWDWQAPAADFEAQAVNDRAEPRKGLRYARPCSWPKPGEPAGATDWRAAFAGEAPLAGLATLAQHSGTDWQAELAWGETATDVCVQAAFERALKKDGAELLRAVQYRRPGLQTTDVLGHKGEQTFRWVAVQSGKALAVLRLSMTRAAYGPIAATIARVIGSLEPLPASLAAAAEPVRELTVNAERGLHVEVPCEWTEVPVAGAPVRATFTDLTPAGAAPSHRLALRVVADPAGFDWGAFWAGLAHPAKKDAKPSGLPTLVGALGQVRSLGGEWGEVRLSRLPFGDEMLPVVWCAVFTSEHVFATAVVCAAGDDASIARARALVERVAGSVN